MNYMQKRAALNKIATLKKAAAAVLLVKLAANDSQAAKAKPDLQQSLMSTPALYGGAGGLALGGLAGALLGDNKNMLRNALLGALSAGAAGYGAGIGYDQLYGKKDATDTVSRPTGMPISELQQLQKIDKELDRRADASSETDVNNSELPGLAPPSSSSNPLSRVVNSVGQQFNNAVQNRKEVVNTAVDQIRNSSPYKNWKQSYEAIRAKADQAKSDAARDALSAYYTAEAKRKAQSDNDGSSDPGMLQFRDELTRAAAKRRKQQQEAQRNADSFAGFLG